MDSTAGGSDDEEVVQVEYAIEETGQPVLAIVEAITGAVGGEARDLEPLEHVVNVEALAELLGHERSNFYRSGDGTSSDDLAVRFRYEDCQVAVSPDRIRVRPA